VAADARSDPSRTATQPGERPIAAAFAASAAVHALVAVLAALAIGGGGVARDPAPRSALRATLAAPPQKFVMPEPARTPTIVEPASSHTYASPRPRALVPVPIPPPRPAEVKGTNEGRATVSIAGADEAPDAAALARLLRAHPKARRVEPDFETEPTVRYPQAALAERRQFEATVLTLVHDDGRLEAAPGTFEDPIFRDSVRAALASAKARPPEIDGTAVTGWALLRFYYEFVGATDAAPDPAR